MQDQLQALMDAVLLANKPYHTEVATINGHKVEAWIVPQGRVTTGKKPAPRITWTVDGKRVAKANLSAAIN